MEAFFAGLIGFLIGKGIPRKDAESIIKALRELLGYEPPLGLTGYALKQMQKNKKYKSSVVVRGKTYSAKALEDISKHDQVSILGKTGDYLGVARTIRLLGTVNLPFKSSLKDTQIKIDDNWISSSPVPAGELWEVTHINCQHAIVADESAKIDVLDSEENVHRVHMELTTREIEWDGHLWLDEGDYIRVIWDTAGKSKVLNTFGVKRSA